MFISVFLSLFPKFDRFSFSCYNMNKMIRGLKLTKIKGGEGSGWHGPPKGDHMPKGGPGDVSAGIQAVADLELARGEAKEAGLRDLRSVDSLDSIRTLNERLDKHGLAFYSKRSNKSVIDFQPHYNPKKVVYLYDDGVSRGTARFENLNRVLTIR